MENASPKCKFLSNIQECLQFDKLELLCVGFMRQHIVGIDPRISPNDLASVVGNMIDIYVAHQIKVCCCDTNGNADMETLETL